MRIALLADDIQWREMGQVMQAIEWIKVENIEELFTAEAEIYINLSGNAAEQYYRITNKPILINSVVMTLGDIKANDNVLRICGWNSFLERPKWEIAGLISDKVKDFFKAIQKEYVLVQDEPGFVAARVVAMIINEAYFALEEDISTKEEMNIAMKLGTNYPYGPFEWSEKIGVKNIYHLLKTLSINDKRYEPAALLQQEATII